MEIGRKFEIKLVFYRKNIKRNLQINVINVTIAKTQHILVVERHHEQEMN